MNDVIFEKIRRYFGGFQFRIYDPAAKGGKGGAWELAGAVRMLAYLRAQNAQGRHIWLKPEPEVEGHFMLHDDADLDDLQRYHGAKVVDGRIVSAKMGRLIIETSPGNFQVWVKSKQALSTNEKLGWLRLFGSDPGAGPKNRSGRAPGFRNRWPRHNDGHGNFPLARLVWVQWTAVDVPPLPEQPKPTDSAPAAWRQATNAASAVLDAAPVTCAPTTPSDSDAPGAAAAAPATSSTTSSALPFIREPRRSDYVDGRGRDKSQSAVDYRYALALLRRGVHPEEVERRLLTEREDWTRHSSPETYVSRTVANAAEFISLHS